MRDKYDVIIVGNGAAGLFCALHLPQEKRILCITKNDMELSDSFLAQGGICVLHDEEDYDSFMEDTLKAGHYKNRRESVDIMIRSSREVINELIGFGVDFARKDGELDYTREGAHSRPRILFHEDITGKEITGTLLERVKELPNVIMLEHTCMVDLLCKDNRCYGIVMRKKDGTYEAVEADDVVLACGGIGGLYQHSTNYRHLTGDALAIGIRHHIRMENLDYIQIHPTTLYSRKPGRRFLISESVRGEGALLYNKAGERFTKELLPRDLLTKEIQKQMEKDGSSCVWLDMRPLGEETIRNHFPNIQKHCLEEGYDVLKECIPVVPAQHYFMGGIWVDQDSHTTMEHLYAAGETSCNGVHGANRLASNSLLESLVFSKRAAKKIVDTQEKEKSALAADQDTRTEKDVSWIDKIDLTVYEDEERMKEQYKEIVLKEIERMRREHE